MQRQSIKLLISLALTFALGSESGISHAALVRYAGSLIIDDTPDIPVVNFGDVFHFEFTIDDSAIDIFSQSLGNFPGAVTDFELTRDSGNISSWDPSTLTLNQPQFLTGDDRSTTGTIYNPQNTIMDTWLVFIDAPIVMRVYGGDTNLSLFDDNGAGQTLAEASGGAFDATAYTTDQGATLAIMNYSMPVQLIDFGVTAIPVPPAVWLFGTALGLLGWMRHRKTH